MLLVIWIFIKHPQLNIDTVTAFLMYSRAFGDNLFNYMGISSRVYTYCITAGQKFKTHTHTHTRHTSHTLGLIAHQRIFVRDNVT